MCSRISAAKLPLRGDLTFAAWQLPIV